MIYAAPKAAARVFGWSPADTLKAAESLAADGLIQLDAAINGIAEPQIVAA